jgi:hypothetical protein
MLPFDTSSFFDFANMFSIAFFAMEMEVSYLFDKY